MRSLLTVLLTMSLLVAPATAAPPDAGTARALPGAGVATDEAVDPVGTWPLRPDPEVVHGFDPPATPWGAGHRGVDLLGRPGQVVRSALPGTVSYAGVLAGRGVVVVSHGATRTTYQPVAAAADLAVGDPVVAGERLGVLEAAGSHCAPRSCLHWGWLEGTTYLDPLRLVGLGPVRLLPLLDGAVPTGVPATATRPVPVASTPVLPASPLPPWW
ncbi:M23 family metallopeptidase [Nocardioides sp.]|uniref:M23 family metallopeptidase n=1 Tax=Nocardioides sp. TaxID=35761 RepID=UPI0026250246|nr:M23 family metallopeptidase [Nocardioides sp.]